MSYNGSPRGRMEADTDDDDEAFLLARDDASRAELHQAVLQPSMDRYSDDDDFLQPSVPPHLAGGATSSAAASSASRAPTGGGGTGLILGELEREVQYWRHRAETLEADLAARHAAHRNWCAELLETLASTWRPRDAAHVDSGVVVAGLTEGPHRAPSVTPDKAADLSVGAFLAAAATQGAAVPTAHTQETHQTAAANNAVATPEGIVHSDVEENDDEATRSAPPTSHDIAHRSAARALRRMRATPTAVGLGLAPNAPGRALGGDASPLDGSIRRVASSATTEGKGNAAVVLVLQRLREQLHTARDGWATRALAAQWRERQRSAFVVWRQWSEQRHAVRAQVAVVPRYRRAIARHAARLLWQQHVKEGVLRQAWNRWGFFLVCRRQSEQVERQVTQYATHGALLGQLVQNHDALWSGLVADIATLLDQQVADLATLKDCASDIVGARRPARLLLP